MGKKLYLPVLFLLSFLLVISCISFTSAAVGVVTLVTPAPSATIGGTSAINITIANGATGNFSCNIYAGSSLSDNSTWTLVAGPISNNTAGFGNSAGINLTFSSAILQDAADYSFNATCFNNTNLWTGNLNTGITVDNTVPQAPSSLSPTNNDLKSNTSAQIYRATVTGVNTTACTLYIGIGGGSYTTFSMTHTSNTCSYTDDRYSSSANNGLYYWYVIATDGTNSSQSSTLINNVQIAGTGGGLPGNEETAKTLTIGDDANVGDSGTGKTLILIGILGAGAYFLFKKK